MIVDGSLLLFAQDSSSVHHEASRRWLTEVINGPARVGLPWPSLLAFLRIRTNPRAYHQPLTAEEAWSHVADWLGAPSAWVPVPTDRHAELLGQLVRRYHLVGNALPDAHLTALALEHGVEVCSADTDFARFVEVRWVNPLA